MQQRHLESQLAREKAEQEHVATAAAAKPSPLETLRQIRNRLGGTAA